MKYSYVGLMKVVWCTKYSRKDPLVSGKNPLPPLKLTSLQCQAYCAYLKYVNEIWCRKKKTREFYKNHIFNSALTSA
jgi:hypothetical protein